MQKTHQDKEVLLRQKIEKAKRDLIKLQKKRKQEIGELAIKAGLSRIDNAKLEQAFKTLAKELADVHT